LTDGLAPISYTELGTPSLRVQTKSDLGRPRLENMDIYLSIRTGEGTADLYAALETYLADMPQGSGLITRERHATALRACRQALQKVQITNEQTPLELLAEDLRAASFELGRVVGHYGVEDILGALFSTFCIGK